jgi:hypothetical protein
MRLLALKADGFVLPAIHNSLVKAFRSLGHEVLELSTREFAVSFKDHTSLERQTISAVFTLDLSADPHFISVLGDLQGRLRIPLISWFVDDPEGYGFPHSCDPEWTLPLCWDRQIAGYFAAWGGLPMLYVPLATDPSIFHPGHWTNGQTQKNGGAFVGVTAHPNEVFDTIARTTPEILEAVDEIWTSYKGDFRQSLHDLVRTWVRDKTGGTGERFECDPLWQLWAKACLHQLGKKKRQCVIKKVLRCDGEVFGDIAWRDAVGDKIYRGSIPYGEKLRDLYNRSSYVLDVRQPQARTGLSQRVYDAGACGTTLIVEWTPELDLLFETEEQPFTYINSDQAAEISSRCAAHPRDAAIQSRKCMNAILSRHTFIHRARQIIDALKEFRP